MVDEPFACRLRVSDGTACQYRARTWKDLLSHQRGTALGGNHGVLSLLAQVSLTNRCIICKASFRSRTEAHVHLSDMSDVGHTRFTANHHTHTPV